MSFPVIHRVVAGHDAKGKPCRLLFMLFVLVDGQFEPAIAQAPAQR